MRMKIADAEKVMPYHTITYEKREKVAYITLNRPATGNMVDSIMSGELNHVCTLINQDDEVNAVILKAAGNVFSLGSSPGEAEAAADASNALSRIEPAVIAAVNGDAFGAGLELALACDIRICSQSARFCLPQIKDGLIPCGGGTQRLARLVGRGKALELVLLGEHIVADEAFGIGLVNKVVPSGELIKEAEGLASKIASQGRVAIMYAKEAVNRGADLALEQGLRLEADLYFLIQTTEDRMEGIRSFLEKRPPQFKGH